MAKLTVDTATYGVVIGQDALGGQYENPGYESLHTTLKAAIRAARSHGWRATVDGGNTSTVAHIERLSDGAQLHPWADPEDWQVDEYA